jgi:ParB family chromosome partitioning protein
LKVEMISTGRIEPPSNPVRAVKIGTMEEMRDSIEADGLYQAIIVRPKGDRYEVVAGYHRYVALTTSGHTKIPCIVRTATDEEALLISIAENVQRNTHLDPIREGEIFRDLIEKKWTINQIAHKIGKKNIMYVADRVRVYDRLHPKLQNRVSKGRLSLQNAKSLANQPLTVQMEVAQKLDKWRKERTLARRPLWFASDQECRRCTLHCPRD